MIAAYEALVAALGEAAKGDQWAARELRKQAKADFRAAVGEEAYAEWLAEASFWREEGMYQGRASRTDEPAGFNLAWGRRWVCKRAHDLGWSEPLHGDFDSRVRGDRTTHTIERIGKKYQWIALYEMCARMADHLQPLPGEDDPADIARLRNIDPTLLVTQTGDQGWQQDDETGFWTPKVPRLEPVSVARALEWLDAADDIYDGVDNIDITDPEDGRAWLALTGFEKWRSGDEKIERESWRRVSCFVVRKAALEAALAVVSNQHFLSSHDIPSADSDTFRTYLGEHPWVVAINEDEGDDADFVIDDGWMNGWYPRGTRVRGIKIRPTTQDYLAEVSGYDASLEANVNLTLPAGWLMAGLGLRLSDGQTIRYLDQDNVVRFMDPSVVTPGRSAALIDRDAFLSYLRRKRLVAIWAVSGEKNVYGGGSREGFGGRLTFTRLFHSSADEIIALERYQTFDKPSKEQLENLRSGEETDECDLS